MELQKVLSSGDWVLSKSSIAGTKAVATEPGFGYGGYPRKPLQRLSDEDKKQGMEGIADAMKLSTVCSI